MEVIIGPIIALLISVGYTSARCKYIETKCNINEIGIESVEKRVSKTETSVQQNEEETLKKVMTTVMPLAKAVNRLNNQVGL
jgi:hypothetical protein